MAQKKKPAAKKPARPAGGAAKPLKKAVAKKAAPKKSVKKPVQKQVAKTAAKKPVAHKPAKPAVKVVPKKPAEKPAKPVERMHGAHENRSLVTVKPQIKPIVKKEPPKPVKVVIPKTTTKSVKKYEPEFTKSVLDASLQTLDAGAPAHRYSDAELMEFRELIMKKLDAAKKELAYLQGLITRKDESGDMDEGRYMTMEDGSVSMEREQLSQMASRQITFIDHLEKAMMRIENKTYGICRVTGRLIDKARLRAVPHATLSIEAKQMMKR
jgi:RNA polymerase-binding transcription factor DksA